MAVNGDAARDMGVSLAAVAPVDSVLLPAEWRDFVALTKPRVMTLVVFTGLCGLLVAVCGLLSDGSVFGTGYAEAQAVLDGQQMPWLFGPLKLVATILSTISGIPGGIFSPSLSVGAGIGHDLSALLPGMPIDTLAILCMAAYLAGVVQAPLTSAVIVSEMTADHSLILPIMICALGASAVSRLVSREGIYHALAARLIPATPESPPVPGRTE